MRMPGEKAPAIAEVCLPVEAMFAPETFTRPATHGFEFSMTMPGLRIDELLTFKSLMNVLVVLMNTMGST